MLEFFRPNATLIPLIWAKKQGSGTMLEFFHTNMGRQFGPKSPICVAR